MGGWVNGVACGVASNASQTQSKRSLSIPPTHLFHPPTRVTYLLGGAMRVAVWSCGFCSTVPPLPKLGLPGERALMVEE